MANKKRPDWSRIKAEYFAGKGSYRQLAAKFGVSFSTLEKRARRESWELERRQIGDEVATAAPAAIAQAIVQNQTTIAAAHFDVWAQVLEKAKLMLEGVSFVPVETAKDLRDLAASLKDSTLGQRLAAGMTDPKAEPPKADAQGGGFLVLPAKSEDWRHHLHRLEAEPGTADGGSGLPDS